MAKQHHRKDHEDRAKIYRDWHRDLSDELKCQDIDQVEYKKLEDDTVIPLANLEITRADMDITVTRNYLDAIVARMEDDGQANAAREFARRMRVEAWIVLFRVNLAEFWIYNLTKRQGWAHVNQPTYVQWLHEMRTDTWQRRKAAK